MDQNAKSQAVERIKEAQNVLITVSTNPSVDQLAAAIGFTLLLNKLEKHATAVFSGDVPSTLEFLKPEETLEQTTDSLRDFIISLDKSKADKLRYKVEDEVVRIFITPYRTHLTQDDLIFSQGDFNVDVVVALGVDNREHIDQAIMAHGRILHDATVIGVMAGGDQIDIGSINWQDSNASSLCEMLMNISESLKSGIVDNQIATAFLTGIVASTDRFKNEKTTPKVMTMSAQLMAAGANQQLIASELTPPEPEPEPEPDPPEVEEPEPDDEPEAPAQNDGEGVIALHHYGEDHQKPQEDEQEELADVVEDQHVHIDDTGEFSNADQLREAVEQVQQHKYGMKSHGKRIQPLRHEPVELPEETSPDVLAETVVQPPEEVEPEPAPQEIDDLPLPGEEIHPVEQVPEVGTEASEELRLPEPQLAPEDLPQISFEDRDREATYLDHPPSTAMEQDEFSVPIEEELPSIEQAGEENYSKYITGKPIIDAPLNAVEDEPEESYIDPLAAIPQAGPLGANENPSTESPLLATQHDAESPLASETPSTPHSELIDDGETDINPATRKPLGPEVATDDTLSEIETNVAEYEGNQQAQPATEDAGAEDAARRAVEQAINQAGPSPYEAPNQNIGAQFVPLDTQPQTVDPIVTNQAEQPDRPPTVPPPIFPIPGVEIIDPVENQSQKNA